MGTGLLISHVLIPPTPGPIAAAGALGIGNNLFTLIMMGTLVSVPTLIVAYVYSRKIGRSMTSCEEENSAQQECECVGILDHQNQEISVLEALFPIILPIFLMAMGTFVGLLSVPQAVKDWISFLGAPMIALTIGLLFAIALLFRQKCTSSFSELTSQTLALVGPILFITAAGGVLGKVIVAAGLVDWIQLHAQGYRSYSLMTFILGCTAMASVFLLSLVF
ncbi:MAG: gluconate:H+ symporter, GntP family [Eubacteriaceae bacterium]|nr:gluconate:H+ symporter, GntP family [Eubacteriaceae bacterium]